MMMLLAVMAFPIEATAQAKTAYAKSSNMSTIPYTDGNGENKTAEALPINSANNDVTLDGGWYYVEGNVTINGQVQFTGDAHINLSNKSQMAADSFKGTDQDGAKHSLCVYGEPLPANATLEDIGYLNTRTITGFAEIIINSGGVMAFDMDENYKYTGEISADIVTIKGGFVICMGVMSSTGSNAVTSLGWNHAATDRIRVSSFSGNVSLEKRFLLYASKVDSPDAILPTGAFTPPTLGDMMLTPLDGYTVSTTDDNISLTDGTTAKTADFTITTGTGTEAVTTPYYIYKSGDPVYITLGNSGNVAGGYTIGDIIVKDADGNNVDVAETETAGVFTFNMPAKDVIIYGKGDPTGIDLMDNGKWKMDNSQWSMVNGQSDSWYDLQGRKLDGQPTKKGVYINKGKKTAIK